MKALGTANRTRSVLNWCWVLQRLAHYNLYDIVLWDLQLFQFHFVGERSARKEPPLTGWFHSFRSMQPSLHVVHCVCAADHKFEVFASGEAQTELRFMPRVGRWLRNIQSLRATLLLYHVDWRCQAVDRELVSAPQLIIALCKRTFRKRRGGKGFSRHERILLHTCKCSNVSLACHLQGGKMRKKASLCQRSAAFIMDGP